jgi:hypothetical protein
VESKGEDEMATTCNAIQTPKMWNIVKVVKSENGMGWEGLTGEVRDISEDGLIGVEFPGWGEGHRLDDHLDDMDGWYLAQEDLEILS